MVIKYTYIPKNLSVWTGIDYTPPTTASHHRVPSLPQRPSACVGTCVFVDAGLGSDSNPGTLASPKRTIPGALVVTRSRGSPSPTIILRGGTYYINATIDLTPADSGLTITAYSGETPVISGGLPVAVSAWSPYNVTQNATWGPVLTGQNAVFGQCGDPGVPNMVSVQRS